LLDVYRAAVRNDPVLAAEQYGLEARRERVPEALSSLLPVLTATAQGAREGGDVTYTDVPTVNRSFNALGWTLQLSLPLLHAQNVVSYRQSRRALDQAQAQFESTQEALVLRVATAYFALLAAQNDAHVAEAAVRSAEAHLGIAKSNFQTGLVSATDVDEATARWQTALSERIAASARESDKEGAIDQFGATPGHRLAGLRADARPASPDPADEVAWISEAAENNTRLRALKFASEVARLDVEKAQTQRLPTIDIIGIYGRSYSSGNNTNPIDYATNAHISQGGLQISMPLVDGGGIHASINEALALRRRAEAELEAARREVSADVRAAYHGVVSGIARIEALQSALAASIRAADGNEKGYGLGLRINSDVLESQRVRYDAERNLARTRYETILETLKLKAAIGSLSESDLAKINAMLETEPSQ
jgi:outer membrane protein